MADIVERLTALNHPDAFDAADELQAIGQSLIELRQLMQTNRDALAATLARLKEARNE